MKKMARGVGLMSLSLLCFLSAEVRAAENATVDASLAEIDATTRVVAFPGTSVDGRWILFATNSGNPFTVHRTSSVYGELSTGKLHEGKPEWDFTEARFSPVDSRVAMTGRREGKTSLHVWTPGTDDDRELLVC